MGVALSMNIHEGKGSDLYTSRERVNSKSITCLPDLPLDAAIDIVTKSSFFYFLLFMRAESEYVNFLPVMVEPLTRTRLGACVLEPKRFGRIRNSNKIGTEI